LPLDDKLADPPVADNDTGPFTVLSVMEPVDDDTDTPVEPLNVANPD